MKQAMKNRHILFDYLVDTPQCLLLLVTWRIQSLVVTGHNAEDLVECLAEKVNVMPADATAQKDNVIRRTMSSAQNLADKCGLQKRMGFKCFMPHLLVIFTIEVKLSLRQL